MSEKTIVLTMYGKEKTVESISISLFEVTDRYSDSKKAAIRYCKNINDLELKDEHWIYAKIVDENEKVFIKKPPVFGILVGLADWAIQSLLRDVNEADIAKALVGADDKTREILFKNMTKRAATMLQERMEGLHGISKDEVKFAQNKIVDRILEMHSNGYIVFAE
jgi:flagellar motor switch protein FliG